MNQDVHLPDNIVDFEVDEGRCRPSMPCKHFVLVNGERDLWSARMIVRALKRLGRPIPDHFHYADH